MENISVNDIGNNSSMTNSCKKKVTFSDNKTIINYDINRFGTISSYNSLTGKSI